MRPGRGWLRFALVGLLTLAVVVGLGAWRVDQHSPIAWNRISVGEQIERHDVLLEVVSLGPTARPLEAVPGSVWIELVVLITPTADGVVERLACDQFLLSGRDRWRPDILTAFTIGVQGGCTTTTEPWPTGEARQSHVFWNVPATVTSDFRVKFEFYDSPWAVSIGP